MQRTATDAYMIPDEGLKPQWSKFSTIAAAATFEGHSITQGDAQRTYVQWIFSEPGITWDGNYGTFVTFAAVGCC